MNLNHADQVMQISDTFAVQRRQEKDEEEETLQTMPIDDQRAPLFDSVKLEHSVCAPDPGLKRRGRE